MDSLLLLLLLLLDSFARSFSRFVSLNATLVVLSNQPVVGSGRSFIPHNHQQQQQHQCRHYP